MHSLPPRQFDDLPLGSLVRVSNIKPRGTIHLAFPSLNGERFIDVESGTILTYLGQKVITYITSPPFDKEIWYLFFTDNNIIWSIDPMRTQNYRSFKWEHVPCE